LRQVALRLSIQRRLPTGKVLARIMPNHVAGRSIHMQRSHCARGENAMNRNVVAATVAAILAVGIGTAGCDKGPMQKAGEKVDEVTGQDKVIGKGPAEKTGRKIDNTVNDIKK
jgi:hypothetical protein